MSETTFSGFVRVYPGSAARDSITLDGNRGSIGLHDSTGERRMLLNPDEQGRYTALFLGENKAGILVIRDSAGRDVITLDGASNRSVIIRDSAGRDSITLDGNRGSIGLHDSTGERRMFLDPNAGEGGRYSALFLGENKAGKMVIRNSSDREVITLDGNAGSINARSIGLYDSSGARNMFLDPNAGGGTSSALFLGESKAGKMVIRDSTGRDSITLDGVSGDIILANADCAEDFDISYSAEIEPGTVMVIEGEGKLRECDLPYDKRVAGVISGGGKYKPGLVLDKRRSIENRKSISLMGKVFCKVDAQSAQIDVGDLLTTSSTRGHAMKAVDRAKAFGSVIGKALKPLEEGSRGMIPVLVALQ